MRSIKFRAWDREKGEWTLPSPCVSHSNFLEIGNESIEVMQFTNLFDKNGKEIYEGDVVRFGDNVIHDGALAHCVWLNTGFVYHILTGQYKNKYTDMSDTWRSYEVVGNIYEQPELLKVDEMGEKK